MNEQAQRIAIAEVCGWKPHADGVGFYRGFHPLIKGGEPAPDYLNDLNAMHEAEKVLTRDQIDSYVYELHELIGRNHIERYAITATSAQRAKAFLRTLNLWKE